MSIGDARVATGDTEVPQSAPLEDRTIASSPVQPAQARLPVHPYIAPIRISAQPRLDRKEESDGFAARSLLPIYGALDLGTNNCRLLVARPSRRGFLVIDAFSRIIRLGEGVSHSGVLSEDAIARTIAALKVCSAKMARRGVTRSRLVATEACRVAKNGPEFVARVRRETGLALEIIGRETEARLAVSGCASLIDKQSDHALIFDIGGGSSEFVWLNLRKGRRAKRTSIEDRLRVQDCIEAWTSLPFGVVTLAERFGGPRAEVFQFEEMVSFVATALAPFNAVNAIATKILAGRTHLLGTSGTVTTIAGVYLGLSEYHRAKVDGCWLSTESIREVSNRIVRMSWRERAAEPCIGAERADLILAGCAIMEAMLRVWPVKCLRVADRGLREGILATLIAEDAIREKSAGMRPRDGRPEANGMHSFHAGSRAKEGAIS